MILFNLISFLVMLGCAAILFWGIKLLEEIDFKTLFFLLVISGGSYSLLLWWQDSAWWLNNLIILASALFSGQLIGLSIRSKGAIITFCLAAAIVDGLSYTNGLTDSILTSYSSGESELLLYLSITLPFGGATAPFIGIGDLVIITGLFSGFNMDGDAGKGAFLAPFSGLIMATTVGLFIGGVPALPFIAATTILYIWILS